MTTQEKSVRLFELMGWYLEKGEAYSVCAGRIVTVWQMKDVAGEWRGNHIEDEHDNLGEQYPDLYESDNMALSWMVLNWAAEAVVWQAVYEYWATRDLWTVAPNKAQAAWLDKILQLAIDAGMVE